MRSRTLSYLAGALCLGAGLVWSASAPRADDAPADAQPGVAVQSRGPIHEAFAQPTGTCRLSPAPSFPSSRPTPSRAPPDQKPDGDKCSGSPDWSWDDETNDFIWVSGCWRVPPPGMRLGAGPLAGGARRLASGQRLLGPDGPRAILPPPPPTLDRARHNRRAEGTSIYTPDLDLPGMRLRVAAGLLGRLPARVGVGARLLCWTPSGCLFIEGYWDHPLDQRGFLFSPSFDPGCVGTASRGCGESGATRFPAGGDVRLAREQSILLRRLTSRPPYEKRGFVAWPYYHPVQRAFDPSYAYYRQLHAGDPKWEPPWRDIRPAPAERPSPRPPRTWTQQTQVVNKITTNQNENIAIHKDVNITNQDAEKLGFPPTHHKNVILSGAPHRFIV